MALQAKDMFSQKDYDAYLSLHTVGNIYGEGEGLESNLKSLAVVLEASLHTQVSREDILTFIHKVNQPHLTR